MSERQRQTEFLKSLMRFGDTEPCRELHQRLDKAQQDEISILRKIGSLIILGLISLAGLGYTAMFVPGAFHCSMPFLVKLFAVLGLSALMCLAVFVGCWIWCRVQVNMLQEEARRLLRVILQSRSQPGFGHPLDDLPTSCFEPDPPRVSVSRFSSILACAPQQKPDGG